MKMSFKVFMIFIIGMLSMIKIKIVGTMTVGELVVLTLSPCYISKMSYWKYKNMKFLILFMFLWILGVIISDIYNGTDLENFAKGFFNVFIMLLSIPVIYNLIIDKPHRILLFWFYYSLSSAIFYFLEVMPKSIAGTNDVWFIYYFLPLAMFLSGLLYYKGYRLLSMVFISFYSIISLWFNSRNIFLTMGISVTVLLFMGNVNELNKYELSRKMKSRFLLLLVSLLFSFVVIKKTYEFLAYNGILGDYAYNKYITQKNSDQGLASGRIDFIQAILAISEKPFSGHGSYSTDKIGSFYLKSYMLNYDTDDYVATDVLPSHSYILGAWVFSGILGALFWLYVIYTIFVFLYKYIAYDPKMIALTLFFSTNMLWNIMFSPFSDRIGFLFYIIIITILINKAKDEEKHKNLNSNTII